MSAVQLVKVAQKDSDIRLDRWFARHYPDLKNGQLQRLIRGKNIRVNGAKTTADYRLKTDDEIRIPPLSVNEKKDLPRDLSKADIEFMQSLVIYKDESVIVLNKPSGIAVQGGSKTERHIDGMLDALRFGLDEKPHLVHRLDKDTSGVLVLGRTANAAAKLAEAFKTRKAQKIYWAVVVGKPKLLSGKIDAPLSKLSNVKGGEQMKVDYDNGQRAQSLYRVLDSLSRKASWLELAPLTGRTHQLRVHCMVLNTPIVGDVKYGDERAVSLGLKSERKMHLHARGIRMPHPIKGELCVLADMPIHMKETFEFLGFNETQSVNPFDYFKKDERA
ncbi:MAG: RluA family pseudouridine synthase [Alphaproteobacteria bacterium]|nr:RluA family pseudouridine synthase [Alphaproteobacteria bacterium]